jgi:hypothetical protein
LREEREMETRRRHSSCTIRRIVRDPLALAAEAVAFGSAKPGHWKALGAFAERDGIDHVARVIARNSGSNGPSLAWWRCTLLLSMEISTVQATAAARELLAIEAAGGGPTFDEQRHRMDVLRAIAFLETHLRRLDADDATTDELQAVQRVTREVGMARLAGRAR